MSYDTDAAERYRLHAAKLRSLAASYQDQETVTILLGVAREYDRMAEVYDTSDVKNVVYLRA